MSVSQNNVHPHKALIDMWSSNTSLQFEYRHPNNTLWTDCNMDNGPRWIIDFEYRLKAVPVPHYYIAYELRSGEKGLSVTRHISAQEYKSRYNHVRYNWVAIVPETMVMQEAVND